MILSHWLRVSGSTCPVNTSRQPVDTSGCLAASPRSLDTRLHPIHGTLRVKNLSVGWKNHLRLTYPSKIQEIPMGSPKKMYEHFEQNLAMSDIFALTLSRFDAISCALSVSRSVYWLIHPLPHISHSVVIIFSFWHLRDQAIILWALCCSKSRNNRNSKNRAQFWLILCRI